MWIWIFYQELVQYKKEALKNKYFFIIYKNEWEHWFNLLSKKSRDLILNKAKDFYKNNKERLRKQARDKYRSLSAEDK